MSDDEVVAKASNILRNSPAFASDLDRARVVVHGVSGFVIADALEKIAEIYQANGWDKQATDLRARAVRMNRRDRMVEPI